MPGRLHIGISGWEYDAWQGEFYPRELAKRRRLEYASRVFDSIEVNGTFYSLETPQTFARWYRTTPTGFLFAVKGSRYITHMLRLRDPIRPLANFFASGVLRLEEKLGPLLWQLPPKMEWNRDRFAEFCGLLPSDNGAAARLARRHDRRVTGRASWVVHTPRVLRHAIEIRDPRMMNEEALSILHGHGHALVFADTAGKFPYSEEITAEFVYVRLHGSVELYASGYEDDELKRWKRRIERWTGRLGPARHGPSSSRGRSRDAFVYFDNDAKVHAPFDALRLAGMFGQTGKMPSDAHGHSLGLPPRIAALGAREQLQVRSTSR